MGCALTAVVLSAPPSVIDGPKASPYEGGRFKLEILLPERYPFEPPKVTFLTPVYHPNIDTGGRICLDTLNMPPKGAWKPSVNISTVLISLHLLLDAPNVDDPLMDDVAHELRTDPSTFRRRAAEHTKTHAMDGTTAEQRMASEVDGRQREDATTNHGAVGEAGGHAAKRQRADQLGADGGLGKLQ